MRSPSTFLLIAVLVTLTPAPATANLVRVAARDGRRAAMAATLGNGGGVLFWGVLSAAGVSSLIIASQILYDVLRLGGASVLVVLGLRAILQRHAGERPSRPSAAALRTGWRSGLVTGVSNPKLAVFFVALFPQFLSRDAAVLPAALGMAATIVALDLVWFTALAYAVDRASLALRPRVRRLLERVTGTMIVGLGIRLASEVR